jgi:hypothetical protein
VFDFRGLRLDWSRLQSYLSAGKNPVLEKQRDLAALLNTVSFHTRMVDNLDEMIIETSNLSLFSFYSKFFEDNFQMCLEFPAQNRFIIVFPLICGHFSNITNELCPEERIHIRERSLSVINLFLDEMSKEAKNIITTVCDEQCTLSDRLLPKHCAPRSARKLRRKLSLISRASRSTRCGTGQTARVTWTSGRSTSPPATSVMRTSRLSRSPPPRPKARPTAPTTTPRCRPCTSTSPSSASAWPTIST